MDSESEVSSAVEVVHILRQMIKNRELLTASFNQGRDSLTTMLLEADPNRGVLVFDGSGDPAVNRQITAAAKVIFSGSSLGAKIRFSSSGAKEVKHQGASALAIRFPASLTRIQKREAFRVKTGSAAACFLPVPGRGSVKVPVNEISVGGVSLHLTHAEDVFSMGQTIAGCRFELGSVGAINCTLEVRSLKRTPSRMLALGCRFVSLPKSSEALVSRFVAQQERSGGTKSGLFSL
jgi:c-di-GMP-binding flagellar brake protein YcgR